MIVSPLTRELIPAVEDLMALGEPYVRVRTTSDYWLYATLFSTTCPVALVNGHVVGAIIAFRSQDNPDEIYIQDVMTHPDHRRQGITRTLLTRVIHRANDWGCHRIHLTSESDNTGAHATWLTMGFANVPGDRTDNGVWLISDLKGPGKHRAVYELILAEPERP